jgi:hypothetical protein
LFSITHFLKFLFDEVQNMFNVSFEINGRKVNPGSIANVLEAAVLEELAASIKKSVGSLRCSEHNQSPSVLIKGKSLKDLSIQVSGCCEDLVEEAKSRLV